MDTIGPDAIAAAAKASPLQAKYGQTIDRESAYEILTAKLSAPSVSPPSEAGEAGASGRVVSRGAVEGPGVVREVVESSAFRSFIRAAATVAGREITRSILGTGRRR